MRHFISLGIRGTLLEIGGVLMRIQGGIYYRFLLRRSHAARLRSQSLKVSTVDYGPGKP